ncbi:Adenosylhomocysteinase [Actinacidiphila bryophytorum]|uniref:Adenosylhomocysteinase n=1 Tax=Actinacidiphila bryophytorum TaxID=1436133 RepID=A0A9W4M908_9ACTN|nr:Adenosylhomocysteinase [Actinacidiphila bryophytorum]
MQPVRCGHRRTADRRSGDEHRRLRVGQASGRVGRCELCHQQRRGQGLRPDVRPDLRRQRTQRQQPDGRPARRAAGGPLVLGPVPPADRQRIPAAFVAPR